MERMEESLASFLETMESPPLAERLETVRDICEVRFRWVSPRVAIDVLSWARRGARTCPTTCPCLPGFAPPEFCQPQEQLRGQGGQVNGDRALKLFPADAAVALFAPLSCILLRVKAGYG